MNEFKNDPNLPEKANHLKEEKAYLYYAPVRAGKTCVGCHADREKADGAFFPNLAEGQLMVVARIRLSTVSLESGFHKNQALLIAVAAGTAILIMGGSYLIVRYVIVKPVKHLKEVTDAIAAGELNVRSEIQTGDEFEDLSHAFNRMLRNLVAHAGPLPQGEHRPRPQGGRTGPGEHGAVRVEPAQERLPGDDEPRVAHAAQ